MINRAERGQFSLSARVAQRLRRAILEGEIGLGDALSEDKLASIFGVSRSPVREALASLEQQGLIDVQPQRGSFVFTPSQEDLAQICEYRRAIETEGLRLSYQRAPAETIRLLRLAADDMAAACIADDGLRSAKADGDFHDALIENCRNSYVQQAYRLASGKVAALRANATSRPARAVANDEHRAIIAFLDDGNLSAAVDALGGHIMNMAERYRVDEGPATVQTLGRLARSPSLEHLAPLD